MSKLKIPFFDYKRQLKKIKPEINQAIERVLNSGNLILGQEVANFESSFSKFIGVKYGVGVNSGTDALKIAARALGLKAGDEIITVANTATPTISSMRELGLSIKFVDVKDDFNIDETKIDVAVTKKTKVIIPVHLYGNPAHMPSIIKIAKKYKLKIIEDSAQGIGALYNGRMVGTIGDVGCFSFYPTKNLGAHGDAGAVVTNNQEIAEKIKSLRKYGERKVKFFSEEIGVNSRMDEIQAALLNWGLKKIYGYNKSRNKIANLYNSLLKNSPVVLPQFDTNKSKSCWHQYVIQVETRDELVEYLGNHGIPTMVYYRYPVHTQNAYKFLKYKDKDLPITSFLSKKVVSLPIHAELNIKDIQFITDMIKKFYNDRLIA
ncbi:MAG: DegT/DnrJ/EryC1/StrS family aminotransferase [bacterium]|nr:DegT/DnrJ/EryC1/StrS family aminotransferase [bacterium]